MTRSSLKITGRDYTRYLTARTTGDFSEVKFQEIAVLSPQGRVQGCFFSVPITQGLLLIPNHAQEYDESATVALKAFLAADRVKVEAVETDIIFAKPKVKDSLESHGLNPLNEYEINEDQDTLSGFFDLPNLNLVGLINPPSQEFALTEPELRLHQFIKRSPVVGRDVPYEISLGEIQTAPFQALKEASKGCFTGQEMVEKIISGKARPPKILSYGILRDDTLCKNEDINDNIDGIYIGSKQIGTVHSRFVHENTLYLYLSLKFGSYSTGEQILTLGANGKTITLA